MWLNYKFDNPDDFNTKNSKNKLTNEEKLKIKYEKAKLKSDSIINKKRKKKNKKSEVLLENALIDKEKNDYISLQRKAKKEKLEKRTQKNDVSVYIREWPIKFLKETQKIKKNDKKDIGLKFVYIIVFIVIFGIIFYFFDLGILTLFKYLKIF